MTDYTALVETVILDALKAYRLNPATLTSCGAERVYVYFKPMSVGDPDNTSAPVLIKPGGDTPDGYELAFAQCVPHGASRNQAFNFIRGLFGRIPILYPA